MQSRKGVKAERGIQYKAWVSQALEPGLKLDPACMLTAVSYLHATMNGS